MRKEESFNHFYFSPYDSSGGDHLPPFLDAKPYQKIPYTPFENIKDNVWGRSLKNYLERYEAHMERSIQRWPVESGMLAPAIYKRLGFRDKDVRAARTFIGMLNTLGVVRPSEFRVRIGLSIKVRRYYSPDEARAIAAIKGLLTIKNPHKIPGDYALLSFEEVQEAVKEVKEILGDDPRNKLIRAPVIPLEKKRKPVPKLPKREPYDQSMDREDQVSPSERYKTISKDSLRDFLMDAEVKIVSQIPSDKYPLSFSRDAFHILLTDLSRCGIEISYDTVSRLLTYIRDYGILRIFDAPYIGSRKHSVLSRNSLRAIFVLAYYIRFTDRGQAGELVERALGAIGEHELREFIRSPFEESGEAVVFKAPQR